jgi:hypothetical protein
MQVGLGLRLGGLRLEGLLFGVFFLEVFFLVFGMIDGLMLGSKWGNIIN